MHSSFSAMDMILLELFNPISSVGFGCIQNSTATSGTLNTDGTHIDQNR